MKINPFKLERYFAIYEFSAKYLLSPSDCESLTMKELIDNADESSLKMWHNLKLGYTESMGHPVLRDEIAGLYGTIEADNVITAVPEEAIFITMHALLEEGDHVVIIDPVYQSLKEIPASIGCSITHWRMEEKEGHWHLDLDLLEESITPETKMIIINFPHNPTGYLPSQEEFRRIIEIARRHDIYLFSDEMYWLLEHGAEMRLPPAADCYEKAISLFGLSKTFSLPGLRMGWIATQEDGLLRKLSTLKDYTTICGSASAEILAIMALRQKEAILEANKKRIHANLEAARDFFTRHDSLFTWLEPGGGSTAFIKLNPEIDVVEFCGKIVEEKSIMIVPGEIFDYEGNYFRVGLGRDNFKNILLELEDYLAKISLS